MGLRTSLSPSAFFSLSRWSRPRFSQAAASLRLANDSALVQRDGFLGVTASRTEDRQVDQGRLVLGIGLDRRPVVRLGEPVVGIRRVDERQVVERVLVLRVEAQRLVVVGCCAREVTVGLGMGNPSGPPERRHSRWVRGSYADARASTTAHGRVHQHRTCTCGPRTGHLAICPADYGRCCMSPDRQTDGQADLSAIPFDDDDPRGRGRRCRRHE